MRSSDYPLQKILRELKVKYVFVESELTALWMLADPEQWKHIYLGCRTIIK